MVRYLAGRDQSIRTLTPLQANARLLSKSLEATGWYTCVSDIHRPKGQHVQRDTAKGLDTPSNSDGESSADYNAGLPVVAFHFSDDFKKDYSHVKQESISTLLRAKQYIMYVIVSISILYPFPSLRILRCTSGVSALRNVASAQLHTLMSRY